MKQIATILSVAASAALIVGCTQTAVNQSESLPETGNGAWVRPVFVDSPVIKWFGIPGEALDTGLKRLELPMPKPYETKTLDKDFVLADVNFNQQRWFTNFSGDISGRFIEACSDVSTKDNPWPASLKPVLDEISKYQHPEGYFGADVDWNQKIDFDPSTDQTKMMPLLWGNGRLLLGLTAAAKRFERADLLETAKKLGDFYVNVVYPRFCDPNKKDEYHTEGQFASAYVTCVYEGMEGLLNLYLQTNDKKYLDTAVKMADFNEEFDTLPVGHSHGSLSQTCAMIRIGAVTGEKRFLDRAITRWNNIITQGFANPAGGVLEHFYVTGKYRDEGCSEADWLRMNLLLWGETGETKYLDMAERILWNAVLPNQWETLGFGHRNMLTDDLGAFGFGSPSQESLWCCTYHIDFALNQMKHYLAMGNSEGIWYNFPQYFNSVVDVNGKLWHIVSNPTESKEGKNAITVTIVVEGGEPSWTIPPVHVRMPLWAEDVKVYAYRTGAEGEKLDVTVRDGTVQGRDIISIYTTETVGKEPVKYALEYEMKTYFEDRRFRRIDIDQEIANGKEVLENAVVLQGPLVYMNKDSGEIETISLDDISTKLVPYIGLTNKWDHHSFVSNIKLK